MARNNPKVRTGGRRTASASSSPFNPTAAVYTNAGQPIQFDDDEDEVEVDDNGIDANDSSNGEESTGLADFRSMTDDEKADFINQALKQKVPSFLPDNDAQRLVYALGGDDHPTIVSDSQLDKTKGYDIYRQVAGVTTKFGDISSADIVNQIMLGDHTQYSDSGGSAYGRSLYFSDSYTGTMGYGTWNSNHVSGGGRDSTFIRCKIDPNAKGVTFTNLQNGYNKEIRSGSKLGRTLSKIGTTDGYAVYALAKGIDYAYDNSWNTSVGSDRYHMIYNRGCLIASSKTKHNAFNDYSW